MDPEGSHAFAVAQDRTCDAALAAHWFGTGRLRRTLNVPAG